MSAARLRARIRIGALLFVAGSLGTLIQTAGGSTSDATVSGKVEIISHGVLGERAQEDASGVVVWLEGGDPPGGRAGARKPGQSTLLQRDKTFSPHTLAIPAGEKVLFPNHDNIFHNVFSLSPAQPFDLGLYKSGEVPEIVFKNPGALRIFCNIHSGMSAFLYVFDQPHFAATRADGTFEIRSVPPGRYRVMHSYRARPARLLKTLDLKPHARETIHFQIDESEYRIQPHLNKFGRSYKEITYKEDTGGTTF